MPANTPTPKPPAALPDGIEIFRAGRHIDDQGTAHQFSEADLNGMAASYDPALREAPLTVGHPENNLPAYGWVKSVARNSDGMLVMSPHQVEPQFAEMVQAGRFKKRSASFYPPAAPNNPTPGKWYLRHVAFLGAQPPAVAGLKDIQFSTADATADGAVSFSESVTAAPAFTPPVHQEKPTMTPEEMQAQIDAANKKTADANAAREAAEKKANEATTQLASFAESAKTQRNAGHVSFAEGEVKAGRLLPKDKGAAVAVLNLLAESQPVEFSEGDSTKKVTPVEWLKGLIANAKPVVSFGEHAPGAGHQPGAGSSKGKTDAEIDTDAKAYARQNKVSYAEALSAVTSSFTS
jgi:hypothetical protein